MKFLICFAALAFVALAAGLTVEQKEKLKATHLECQKQTNVDNEVLKKVKDGEFADDAKLKAQLLCVNKKLGVQDEDGKLNVERVREGLTKRRIPNVDEVVNKCIKDEATPEETAWVVAKCLSESRVRTHNY